MASITSSAGNSMNVGQTSTITYSAAAGDGCQVDNLGTCEAWFKMGNTTIANGTIHSRNDLGANISGTYSFTPLSPGTYTFTVYATAYGYDNDGYDYGPYTDTTTLTITVTQAVQVSKTTSHTLTATASNYTSLQWKESADGTSWTDAANGTGTELIIATGTGTGLGETAAVQASYTAIASYDKYVKCVATNAVGNTESNVKHVTFTSGDAAPTATDV